jgi:hypothetical protein
VTAFLNLDFATGLAVGVCFIVHCWASEKAFGKWWKGMAILAGFDS